MPQCCAFIRANVLSSWFSNILHAAGGHSRRANAQKTPEFTPHLWLKHQCLGSVGHLLVNLAYSLLQKQTAISCTVVALSIVL